MRRIFCCILALLWCVMLPVQAVAELVFIPQMGAWNLESAPLEVTLKADVTTHMPFDDNRTAQLNALLNHVSLRLNWQQLAQETWSRMAILVDDQEAVSLAMRQLPTETLLQLSSVPDRSFSFVNEGEDQAASALGTLMLGETTEPSLYGLNGTEEAWLNDGYALLQTIGASLDDYKTETSVKTTIKNIGTARTKQVFTIPKAEVEKLPEAMADACPEGKLRTLLTSLVFSGKQTLTLYRSESGMLLRADYAGSCGVDEDHLRTVSLTWKMRRDETAVRDELTLKSPAVSGTDRNTLTLERVLTSDQDSNLTLTGEFTYEWVLDKQKTTLSGTINLTNAVTEEASHVTGTVIVKQLLPGEDTASSITLTPDLVIDGDDGRPSAIGSILVEGALGKKILEQANISLVFGVGEYFDWELRDSIVPVDQLTENQADLVVQEISASIATALIRPLVLLPREDTLYLSADLPEETWQKIVDAAQSALQ